VRQQSQERAEVALRAAGTRLAPTAAGALAGVAAVIAMPHTTEGTDYFSVVVQVLPVLLLALAIETRAFGGRARRNLDDERSDPRHYCAGTMELGRQIFLNPATVLVLLAAEMLGIDQLVGSDGETHEIWLQNAALGWGFTTVAVLALIGQGAPRLTATLETKLQYSDNAMVVELGASNEYGDKDVAPVMNFLVPNGVTIHVCDVNGNKDGKRSDAMQVLHTSEKIAGIGDWNYPSRRVHVSAGDAAIEHLLLGGLVAGRTYPLVLRYDHIELPNGRVEVRLDLRLSPSPL
jgi:hypothetical protein